MAWCLAPSLDLDLYLYLPRSVQIPKILWAVQEPLAHWHDFTIFRLSYFYFLLKSDMHAEKSAHSQSTAFTGFSPAHLPVSPAPATRNPALPMPRLLPRAPCGHCHHLTPHGRAAVTVTSSAPDSLCQLSTTPKCKEGALFSVRLLSLHITCGKNINTVVCL